jgi:hypothetical protein
MSNKPLLMVGDQLQGKNGHHIDKNGNAGWYFNGMLHQEDSPALMCKNGDIMWYHYGRLHRLDGPAIVNERRNYKAWYQYGVLHREDGPAIEDNEILSWYQQGQRHRTNGAAIIYIDSGVEGPWYTNGERIPSPNDIWLETTTLNH